MFAEPAVTSQPAKGTFHHPAFGQQLEAFDIVRTLHNLHGPVGDPRGPLQQMSGVSAIGPNQPQTREPAQQFPQHPFGSVPVLYATGMHHSGQDHSERFDDDMPLASVDLLARVVPAADPLFSVVVSKACKILSKVVDERKQAA